MRILEKIENYLNEAKKYRMIYYDSDDKKISIAEINAKSSYDLSKEKLG